MVLGKLLKVMILYSPRLDSRKSLPISRSWSCHILPTPMQYWTVKTTYFQKVVSLYFLKGRHLQFKAVYKNISETHQVTHSPEVGLGPPAPPCANNFYPPTGYLRAPLLWPPLQHPRPHHWLCHSLPMLLPCWKHGPPLHRLGWDITAAAPASLRIPHRSYFQLLPPPQPLFQGRKQQHRWTPWQDLAKAEQWCDQHPCLHGHLPAGG